jgi:hemoglobin
MIQINTPRASVVRIDPQRFSGRTSAMNTSESETSLFDRIGGVYGLTRMVGQFYARVLADRALRPYFEGVPLEKLHRMQLEFFAAALGGPTDYSGRTLHHAHQGRSISREHFQAFVEYLFETLKDFPLTENERYAVIARINTYVDDVVGNGTAPSD